MMPLFNGTAVLRSTLAVSGKLAGKLVKGSKSAAEVFEEESVEALGVLAGLMAKAKELPRRTSMLIMMCVVAGAAGLWLLVTLPQNSAAARDALRTRQLEARFVSRRCFACRRSLLHRP